jgi:hypothetical protein
MASQLSTVSMESMNGWFDSQRGAGLVERHHTGAAPEE